MTDKNEKSEPNAKPIDRTLLGNLPESSEDYLNDQTIPVPTYVVEKSVFTVKTGKEHDGTIRRRSRKPSLLPGVVGLFISLPFSNFSENGDVFQV